MLTLQTNPHLQYLISVCLAADRCDPEHGVTGDALQVRRRGFTPSRLGAAQVI